MGKRVTFPFDADALADHFMLLARSGDAKPLVDATSLLLELAHVEARMQGRGKLGDELLSMAGRLEELCSKRSKLRIVSNADE